MRRERGFGVNPWRTHSRFLVSHNLLIDPTYTDPLREWLGAFLPGSLLILDEVERPHGYLFGRSFIWRMGRFGRVGAAWGSRLVDRSRRRPPNAPEPTRIWGMKSGSRLQGRPRPPMGQGRGPLSGEPSAPKARQRGRRGPPMHRSRHYSWHYFSPQLWLPGSPPLTRGMESPAIQTFRNKPRLDLR
jgi:hypothetical protein